MDRFTSNVLNGMKQSLQRKSMHGGKANDRNHSANAGLESRSTDGLAEESPGRTASQGNGGDEAEADRKGRDCVNYYPHHIGDFNNATRHLTRVERALYRDAIELYYETEQPLLGDDFERLAKRLIAVSDEEKSALRDVLNEFFTLKDGSYHHARCDMEIAKYRANAESKSKAGMASAAKRQHKSTPVEHVLDGCATNQEPRTKNQEQLKAESKASATATRLPADWVPSDADYAFCRSERPDLSPSVVADRFRDYWVAVPGAKGRKVDWRATWRNWVRNENGGSNGKNGSSRADRVSATIAELTGANRHPSDAYEGTATRVD